MARCSTKYSRNWLRMSATFMAVSIAAARSRLRRGHAVAKPLILRELATRAGRRLAGPCRTERSAGTASLRRPRRRRAGGLRRSLKIADSAKAAALQEAHLPRLFLLVGGRRAEAPPPQRDHRVASRRSRRAASASAPRRRRRLVPSAHRADRALAVAPLFCCATTALRDSARRTGSRAAASSSSTRVDLVAARRRLRDELRCAVRRGCIRGARACAPRAP